MFVTPTLSIDEKAGLQLGVSLARVIRQMPWLNRPLVETEAARQRLRDWIDAGGLDRQAPPREAVRTAVAYYGDIEMLAPVVDAFEQMAPPAREWVIEQATIIGTGWSSHGWTGASPMQPRPRIIALCGDSRDPAQVRRVMLHEAAHTWLEANPTVLATALGHMNYASYAAADGFAEQMAAMTNDHEARAEALRAAWAMKGWGR